MRTPPSPKQLVPAIRLEAAVAEAKRLASSCTVAALDTRSARLVVQLDPTHHAQLAYEIRLRHCHPTGHQPPRVFVISADSGKPLAHTDDFTAYALNGSRQDCKSSTYMELYRILAYDAGWGASATFGLFTRANLYYWTPRASPLATALALLDAARDLGLDESVLAAALAEVRLSLKGPRKTRA